MTIPAPLLQALRCVLDDNGAPLLDEKNIRNLVLAQGRLSMRVELGYPAASQHAALRAALEKAALGVEGVQSACVEMGTRIVAHVAPSGAPLLQGVKNVVAVASGKGGVGKSTTAANLALALAAEGAVVGLLDADIYGPSVPMMMGASGRPHSFDGHTLEPLRSHGVRIMSMGFLVDADQPMIWRGPMAAQALEQILHQTHWGSPPEDEVDYLIVDMPPGTGDIQLSLCQRVPLTGAVMVTTPQDLALLDVSRGIAMFQKVGVPILGVVENMAVHVCSQCGNEEHIFGADGGKKLAQAQGLAYLGALPLALHIRQHADGGTPTVLAEPQSATAQSYGRIARKLAATIAAQARDHTHKFPPITISRDT